MRILPPLGMQIPKKQSNSEASMENKSEYLNEAGCIDRHTLL